MAPNLPGPVTNYFGSRFQRTGQPFRSFNALEIMSAGGRCSALSQFHRVPRQPLVRNTDTATRPLSQIISAPSDLRKLTRRCPKSFFLCQPTRNSKTKSPLPVDPSVSPPGLELVPSSIGIALRHLSILNPSLFRRNHIFENVLQADRSFSPVFFSPLASLQQSIFTLPSPHS